MTLLFAKASLLSRKSVTWEPLAVGMKFLYVIEGRISCPQHALVTSLLVFILFLANNNSNVVYYNNNCVLQECCANCILARK